MTDHPHSSPTAEAGGPTSGARSLTKALLAILRYVASYLLGIVTCVLFTQADLSLAGVRLWPWYPVLAVIGFFLFYFHLSPAYSLGSTFIYWFVFSIGLIPVVSEAAAYFVGTPRFRVWRPLWIGFPIGFVGTLGAVSYTHLTLPTN